LSQTMAVTIQTILKQNLKILPVYADAK